MKEAIVLAFVAVAISAVHSTDMYEVIESEWSLFKTQYKKIYNDFKEEAFRKKVYLENKISIARHNKLYEEGEETYQLGMNRFGDLMAHEFAEKMNGFRQSLVGGDTNYTDDDAVTFMTPENVSIPESVDWRKLGYVTPVKDQGDCRSCWAFSSTGALEGQIFRKTGKLVSLSEQNLIDCSLEYGNDGCDGGFMNSAFQYIKANKGIDTKKSYPYEAKDDKCQYKSSHTGATDKGFVDIPRGDEKALLEAVATIGPISVAIDSSSKNFRFYKEGVFYSPLCGSNFLDHALLVVGYGTDKKGRDYWIVKNSWSTTWGEKGYILMARNKNNNCGIASGASYPLV